MCVTPTRSWIFRLKCPVNFAVAKTVTFTGGLAFEGNCSELEGPPPTLGTLWVSTESPRSAPCLCCSRNSASSETPTTLSVVLPLLSSVRTRTCFRSKKSSLSLRTTMCGMRLRRQNSCEESHKQLVFRLNPILQENLIFQFNITLTRNNLAVCKESLEYVLYM